MKNNENEIKNLVDIIKNIIAISVEGKTINKNENTDLFLPLKPSDMGMSGALTRILINNLCAASKDITYLEVGLASGSTFSSAVYENNTLGKSFIGFDTFTGTKNKMRKKHRSEMKKLFYERLSKYNTMKSGKIKIIEDNFFNVDLEDLFQKENLKKADLYFYDAEHTSNSTFYGLIHAYNVLKDTFIYIVDDWNDKNVRKGCWDSIKEAGVDIEYYESFSAYAGDLLYENKEKNIWKYKDIDPVKDFGDYRTFYNGIGIFILSKNKKSIFDIVKNNRIKDELIFNYEKCQSICLESKYDKNEIMWNVE